MSGQFDDIIRQVIAEQIAAKGPVKPDTVDELGVDPGSLGAFQDFLKQWQEEMGGLRKPIPKPTEDSGA